MKKAAIALAGALFLLGGAAQAQQSGALNDAQIAAITVAANDVDIANGNLAKKQAASQEVKAYAERMIVDHTRVNRSAKELVKKLNMKPQDNSDSEGLKSQGKETMKKLKDLKGAAFDTAYIDNEVLLHQSVIDTVDKSLIPNAKNGELKALLEHVRPILVQHLEHAKQLQASLGGKKG